MNSLTWRAAWFALASLLLVTAFGSAQNGDKELVRAILDGNAAYDAGRWQDAERLLSLAMDKVGANFPTTNPYEYAHLVNRCGYACTKTGNFAKAERLIKAGLAIREEKGDAEVVLKSGVLTGSRAIAESKGRLGYLYIVMSRFTEAQPLFEDCLNKGGNAAECQYHLGMICRILGQYDRARQFHDAALRGRQQEIANLEEQVRADPKNAKLQKQRLTAYQATAFLRNDRGLLFHALGQYGTARTEFDAAEKLWDYTEPQGRTPDKANFLMNVGNVCRDLGEFETAAAYFAKSRTIWDLFPDHLGRAKCLQNQGIMYMTLFFKTKNPKDQAAALQCCNDCMAICDKHTPNADVALYLSNIGWLYHGMGEKHFKDAERAYARSLQLWRQFQPNHPDHARTLSNTGWLLHCMGDPARALQFYAAGRKLRLDSLGQQHHTIALSDANLAALHGTTGEWSKALPEMTDALKGLRTYEGRELAYLPDAEQLAFLLNAADAQSHASIFHIALSLARDGRNDQAVVQTSAEWVINGKAVSHEALAQKILQSRDPVNADLVRRLTRVRTSLSRLTANPPDGKEPKAVAAHRQEFQKLKTEERAAEQELAQQLQKRNGGQSGSWVSLESVREGIPPDAVLIETVRFRVWNFQSKKRDPWESEHYAAWIIPPRGEVRFVDLGPAADIDAPAEGLQTAMVAAEKLYNSKDLAGIKEQETRLRAGPLQQLQERLVDRLRAAIDPRITRWIVSPDGSLWLAPLGAMPQDNGKYLIDTHNISYVVSGRDLAPRPHIPEATTSVVLAAPTYGSGTRNLGHLGPIVFPLLPNAPAEAKAVIERLPDAAQPIQGDAATETAFRRLNSPRVLHLVTHGFALKKTEESDLPQDPLSLCGLALVGANDPKRASNAADDDGLLMGKEVLAVDLRGTQLVTLSACQTGLGRVSSGESVASLRQAFHLAGAQNVVATLWSIPDTESTRLMVSFYDHMRKDPQKRRADCLCQAQRDTLRLLRAQGKTNPFYWAAFTLSGQDTVR